MFLRILVFLCVVFPVMACQAQPAPADAIEITVGAENAKRSIVPGGGQDENQSFRDCPDCPEMVVVPAGSFMMGEPSGTTTDQKVQPQHRVTIAKPFAIGKFTVTFDEWLACLNGHYGCYFYRPSDEKWGEGDRPVINVNWLDARAYVKWLSKKTGKRYRLPSEAEWEYAARAGTTTRYWWGEEDSREEGNFNSGTWLRPADSKTVPVKSYRPNPWGLYQVHGNVMQWTQDCYTENYNGAPVDGSAWLQGDCDYRMRRGSSWMEADGGVAIRAETRLDRRAGLTGFRVVRDLP